MRTKKNQEGYLLVDHRNSPGTPLVGPGQTFESATTTCSHCHAIVVLNPLRQRERAYCHKCDHYICDTCAKVMHETGTCNPMSKKIDEAGNRAALGLTVGELTRG